jgi:hypothetical protein
VSLTIFQRQVAQALNRVRRINIANVANDWQAGRAGYGFEFHHDWYSKDGVEKNWK